MGRRTALRLIGGGVAAALTGCGNNSDMCFPVPASTGSSATPTSFGCTIYSQDTIGRAVDLIAGCGGVSVRAGLNGNLDFSDQVCAEAARRGLRVVLISPYASQPVDVAAYAANCAAIHRRYVQYDPIWEIWNEPNLPQYWGAPPDVDAYIRLAIPTAQALRNAGATDVWSGGTSGIDVAWTYPMTVQGAFNVMNGCAVHSYNEPCSAYAEYIKVKALMPPGVLVHTTESCVPSTTDQDSFLRQMWYVHRLLGIPTLIWCELRDGTAGAHGPYTYPYGLVYSDYAPKSSYYTAKSLTAPAKT